MNPNTYVVMRLILLLFSIVFCSLRMNNDQSTDSVDESISKIKFDETISSRHIRSKLLWMCIGNSCSKQ